MSLGALVLLSPLLAIAAAVVRISMGRPVLFRQLRAGLGGVPFQLVKLRTMTDRTAGDGALLPDVERLTSTGRVLRTTSIDELPQLWNVLRGDMSLVGPRPLPVRYLDRYTRQEGRRHEVRPGITGLAQISGRNDLGWDKRLALDVWYVDHGRLATDLRVLALTIGAVLRRQGVTTEGQDTMPEFRAPERHP